jgi:hypothetical protein
MRPWVIPLTSLLGVLIIAFPAFRVVRMLDSQEQARTDYYLSIRVQDVSISQVDEHVQRVGAEFRSSCAWIVPQIKKAHAEFSEGVLFLFNTSEEQWRALEGELGYAIVLNGRIVWKKRIAIS